MQNCNDDALVGLGKILQIPEILTSQVYVMSASDGHFTNGCCYEWIL